MVTMQDLERPAKNNWCPGCGNFGILTALKMAIVDLKLEPYNVVLVSGIGCSSKIPYWVKTIGFNSIHGRGLPVAEGIKLANTKLTVISAGGDGDGLGEGLQHFIHACKRNINLSYIMHDNQIYALTKGQTSPTSCQGFTTKTTPDGNLEIPLNPVELAIISGATFVARGFAGDIPHLKELIKEAIQHKGFAFVHILQPCVSFNHLNTFSFWKERVYKLDEGHDPHNKQAALAKSFEFDDRVPLGIFYREQRPTYEEQVITLKEKPLVEQPFDQADITENMEKLV